MKDTAPISLGIMAVAAIFGIIAAGVAFVAWDFGIVAAFIIGLIVAAIVMLLLWLGWRDPAPSLQDSYAANRAELDAKQASGAGVAAGSAGAASAPSAPSAAPAADAPTAAASAPTEAPAAPEPAAAAAPAAAVSVKTGTVLPGEQELSERKGDWKYEADADASAKAPAATKEAAPAEPAPAAAPEGEDYDGDGVVEGKDEGTRPEALSGPRDGKADNLKEIKGVGPKMEKMCNALGFYHFDQIANWTPDEVAWVDANLEGFKGRVTRDTWVEQAKILAAGGETEFSKKVDKGGVY